MMAPIPRFRHPVGSSLPRESKSRSHLVRFAGWASAATWPCQMIVTSSVVVDRCVRKTEKPVRGCLKRAMVRSVTGRLISVWAPSRAAGSSLAAQSVSTLCGEAESRIKRIVAHWSATPPALTCQDLSRKRSSFLLKQKSNWKRITLLASSF